MVPTTSISLETARMDTILPTLLSLFVTKEDSWREIGAEPSQLSHSILFVWWPMYREKKQTRTFISYIKWFLLQLSICSRQLVFCQLAELGSNLSLNLGRPARLTHQPLSCPARQSQACAGRNPPRTTPLPRKNVSCESQVNSRGKVASSLLSDKSSFWKTPAACQR